ncbi:MAG: hypothetical protein JXB85_18005 [Anaerolineales bacterium]|nr:hypothetical protein [Anaerolineales bacterium]
MFQQSQNLQIVAQSKRHVGGLLGMILVFVLWGFGFEALQTAGIWERARIWSTYIILLLEFQALRTSLQLARLGRRPSPLLMWTGFLVIVGGIWFDVLATIAVSPGLEMEANPIIATFRDARYPDWLLYFIGAAAQVMLTLLSCVLWAAFLRHAPVYLNLLWALDPHNLFQFVLTSLGLNPHRPFVKQRPDLFPRTYRIFWPIVLVLIAPFNRLLLGLSWMIIRKGLAGEALTALETGIRDFTSTVFMDWMQLILVGAAFLLWLLIAYASGRHWQG